MLRIGFLCSLSLLLSPSLMAQDAAGTSTNKPAAPAAPPIYAASAARAHVGVTATVTGTIAEVNFAPSLVRLNFDEPFPKQTFTAVIFAPKTNLFGDLAKLKGKRIEVTGKITEYRERPQIVLTSTNQLTVLEHWVGDANVNPPGEKR